MSICSHEADHLSEEQPKSTGLHTELGLWNSYTKQLEGGGHLAELNLTISTGEGSERLHAQVLIFDKRSRIIAQFKSVQDRLSAVLSSGARLQTGPLHRWSLTAFFFGFPLNSEKLERLCVLVESMSKSSSCFVWKGIKRSKRGVKIKRDAEFSGPTPWL